MSRHRPLQSLRFGARIFILNSENFICLDSVNAPFLSQDLSATEISGVFMALVNAHPELSKFNSLDVAPVTPDADLDMAQALSASTRQRMSVASILADFGAQCSSTPESFRQILKEIGIALEEEQVAEIIVSVLAQNRCSDIGDIEDTSSQWNTDVIGEVLCEDCRGLNWTVVAAKLDQPILSIRSEVDFLRLLQLFSRISECPLPGAGLLNLWDNRAAQLALIVLSANAPKNAVDFSSLVTQEQRIPGEVPFPPNFSWMCLSLYSSLIGLAHSGLALEVTDALIAASGTYPEYIAVGLAQIQDPTSGVRAEVLRRTLPMFTGLPGSRATSMAVMMKLQSVNPDLVILLTRIALKRASSKQEMVDIDSRLKSLGPVIIRRVEEECLSEELIGYWCVKADKGELNLEERIMSALERNPQTVRAFIGFAELNAHTLRPAASDGGLLSSESFGVLLRAAQVYPSIVSIEEIRALAALMAQQQQNILLGNQNVTSDQVAENATSDMGSSLSHDIPRLNSGPESDEVEEEANAYFQKIYTSDITIADVIQLLKQFKSSTNVREQEVFRCMIHNLFDEYRFFHKYPDKELLVTGRLFGTLIQHQLISSITLGIALRYVLEALRKDPDVSESNEKMFRFGKISLEQFRPRLGEWPQYCSHLVQIPHLLRHCPELFNDAQRAINNPLPSTSPAQPNLGAINGIMDSDQIMMGSDLGIEGLESRDLRKGTNPSRVMPVVLDASPTTSASNLSQQLSGLNLNALDSKMLPLSNDEVLMLHGSAFTSIPPAVSLTAINGSNSPTSSLDFTIPPEEMSPPVGASMMAQLVDSVDLDIMVRSQPILLLPAAVLEACEKEVFRPVLSVIERMALVNVDVLNTTLPPESIRDQIHFIVNNIAKSNCEAKSVELRNLLTNDHFNWFANYLVVKRISTQPNLHSMYLTVLDSINSSNLSKVVLDSVYHNVTKLLQSPNITTSSSERSLLRNLGIWLGQTTLARNKPLLQRRVNLKDLLFWGYGTGRLIAVCSFVARIIEGARDSKVFRPPNPWLMALLGVLREMYETEDLKMNIKFEVQVLCKNINIKIEDIQRTTQLTTIPVPIKDARNPDFNVKATAAVPGATLSPMSGGSPVTSATALQTIQQGITMPQRSEDAGIDEANKQTGEVSGAGVSSQEQTVIPNLAAYVTINSSLQFFATNPAQRRLVSLAVDRAIREIIQPVVERSVTIASVTTKQLILKDFSTEPNEQQLRSGAHLMISNLAGSLALVTCKEPLRVSIGNHLRSLLQQVTSDQSLIEQIVQVCSNDNLELGCMLIEKASTEKAIRDVDESLAVAIQSRRKSREANQAFIDTTAKPGAKYPRELPDALKPNVGGLHPQQLLVYEGFQRARAMAVAAQQQQQQQQQSTSVTSSPALGGMQAQGPQQMTSLPPSATSAPSLSMSQALDGYQHLSARIDMSLKAVSVQAPGRDVSISMLAADHEILALLRELVMVTQRTQPAVRNETAMTFCENLFKRMVESVNVLDTLRLEVMIGIIEALRDACGGAKKFAPDIVSWLSHYAGFNPTEEVARKMHRAILILLLRVKLIRSQEVDTYFAIYMDSGRNMVWVELALSFVRQCLAEGLAATYEFASTFETVSKMRPANTAVRKQLQKWLTDLRTLAASKEEQKAASGQQQGQGQPAGATAAVAAARDASVREHVTVLLERWLRVWTSTNDQVFGQYLQLMHQYGVLKTEEAADRFFRIATELCAEACLNSAQQTPQPQGSDSPASALTYTVVDALSKLFLLLVRLADKEAGDMTVRVNLLSRILNAVARTLLEDHETKKTNKQPFDQRPYFRLLSSLAQDLGVPDVQQEPNPAMTPLLGAYSQVYLILQPSVVPGFAFAWLQLISHRCFMPQLLLLKSQKGWPYMHRLVIALLLFLQPFLKHAQLNDSIRKLYKVIDVSLNSPHYFIPWTFVSNISPFLFYSFIHHHFLKLTGHTSCIASPAA